MSAEEKVAVLTTALETIREATFAEFQIEFTGEGRFNPKAHVCPLCRRASTADHLRRSWALIQATAAGALRECEED